MTICGPGLCRKFKFVLLGVTGLLTTSQDLGAEESVLQNHYNRNHAPRAPHFQPNHAAPPTHKPPPLANANTKARTLESYPPQWQEVITNAKRAFRTYVASKCGFPDGVEGLNEARDLLLEVSGMLGLLTLSPLEEQ